MNIAVCVCQVPDTASVIGYIDGVLDYSRVNRVMNPYDEYAVEEAVRLKERFEGSVVTVFTFTSDSSKEVLRKALAMGADRAVQVSCKDKVSEPFQTAQVLSQAITEIYLIALPDLIFCGKQSTDFQSAQVPSMLAEMLGMASVNGITALAVSDERLQVEREIEGGVEYIDLTCPAVLSTEKGLNTPRNTSIRAVMDARKKSLDLVSVSLNEAPFVVLTGMKPIERKKNCCIVPDEKELIRILTHERNVI